MIPHISVNIQLSFFSVSRLLHCNITRGPGNAGNEMHCWKESWIEGTQLFSSAGKESASSTGDTASIPGLGGSSGEGIERPGYDPWVGEIPRRRAWQPTPVFLPRESHGQRGLANYSPWGCRESDRTEGISTQARRISSLRWKPVHCANILKKLVCNKAGDMSSCKTCRNLKDPCRAVLQECCEEHFAVDHIWVFC